MNIKQKITMIMGAMVLLIAILTTPSYLLIPTGRGIVSEKYDADSELGRALTKQGYRKIFDIGNVLVRVTVVLGAAIIIGYALRDKRNE